METKEFKSLFLNIHDELKITFDKFYYRIVKEEEGGNLLEYRYEKPEEKGWKCRTHITGKYCGFRNDNHTGELSCIKVHVTSPFKMVKYSDSYHMYIELSPTAIVSIEVTRKKEPSGSDKICHELTKVGV